MSIERYVIISESWYTLYVGMVQMSKSRINILKVYLNAQSSSLSAFMICKIRIVAQKPHGRQLNAEVCGSESAIFVILLSFFIMTTLFNSNDSKTVQVLTIILAQN